MSVESPFPRQVHIETFGCQMNEYDSELVRALLKREGFVFTEDRERADVILMNTCAIRENAQRSTRIWPISKSLRRAGRWSWECWAAWPKTSRRN